MMKNAKKIYGIGQLLLILGSALYIVELVAYETWALTMCILGIYVAALALMLVGWYGTREERRIIREREKAEQADKKRKRAAA